jgi:hypothetical protein
VFHSWPESASDEFLYVRAESLDYALSVETIKEEVPSLPQLKLESGHSEEGGLQVANSKEF